MSLISMEGKYGAIGTDNYSCRGYYIIKFYFSPNTLQADLSIDGQFISSGNFYANKLISLLSILILIIMFTKKKTQLSL